MSPPCQPYTRRGQQRDWDDPRTAALRNMIRLIRELRPHRLAMENVPEFAHSESHKHLLTCLSECGYSFAESELCPNQFGVPNRRRRFYLIATHGKVRPWRKPTRIPQSFFDQLRAQFCSPLADSTRWHARHLGQFSEAMNLVSLEGLLKGEQVSNCFTSAYGRSPVHCGSYVDEGQEVRFFTPREVLTLLGFSADFRLPDWSAKRLWPLVGNSLSLPVVEYVVGHF